MHSEHVMQGILGPHLRTDVRFSVLHAQTGCNFLGQMTDRLILKKTSEKLDRWKSEALCHMTLTQLIKNIN